MIATALTLLIEQFNYESVGKSLIYWCYNMISEENQIIIHLTN